MRALTRRRIVAGLAASVAAPAWVAGCREAPVREVEGGWVGANVERGHVLREAPPRTGASPQAETGPARRVDVAVLGGGVAGLAAARALRRAGVEDLRVFELEVTAGGNARGHTLGGLRCPLGAHYLPVPGEAAHEVRAWLHELGVARQVLGRTVWDERHLAHAPQERVFAGGRWVEGLWPADELAPATLAALRRFAAEVRTLQRDLSFAMPTLRSAWSPGLQALDATSFAAWLDARGHTEATLRAHLDYTCRDDYGARPTLVSAWAGLHYFASRHGFHAPGDEEGAQEPVLTWPEGNGWLTERLAEGLGDRLQTGALVRRVQIERDSLTLTVDGGAGAVQRWQARQVIVALPLFVAARLLDPLPPALADLAPRLVYAPWLVSNLLLREPLIERGTGAPPAWDNVIAGSPALGYVDAGNQRLNLTPGPTVLTHYWALGGASLDELAQHRAALLRQPWAHWREAVLADLRPVHPDLPDKLLRAEGMRYGHAMLLPRPGLRGDAALAALGAPSAAEPRLHFAHADLSAYSVFEEAFTRGTLAGAAAARALARG